MATSDVEITQRAVSGLCANQGDAVFARNRLTHTAVLATIKAEPESGSEPGYPKQDVFEIAAGGETHIGCERFPHRAKKIRYSVVGVVEKNPKS